MSAMIDLDMACPGNAEKKDLFNLRKGIDEKNKGRCP